MSLLPMYHPSQIPRKGQGFSPEERMLLEADPGDLTLEEFLKYWSLSVRPFKAGWGGMEAETSLVYGDSSPDLGISVFLGQLGELLGTYDTHSLESGEPHEALARYLWPTLATHVRWALKHAEGVWGLWGKPALERRRLGIRSYKDNYRIEDASQRTSLLGIFGGASTEWQGISKRSVPMIAGRLLQDAGLEEYIPEDVRQRLDRVGSRRPW